MSAQPNTPASGRGPRRAALTALLTALAIPVCLGLTLGALTYITLGLLTPDGASSGSGSSGPPG